MTEASERPGILARVLGSMLRKVRELADLSYAEAAAQLGCDADWLARVETGFAVASPEEVERILTGYGARTARVADEIIDLARRAANPPPWLARHATRLSSADRDLLLVEAQATLAQVHGFRLIPYLVQTQEYFRLIAPGGRPELDVDLEWDLLASRQDYRPAGVTRLLDVIIDETAFDLRLKDPGIMAGQLRHLLSLADSPHATVRVIPADAAFWESRRFNFDVLSFAGTADRIGVAYSILGAHLASGDDLYEAWTLVAENSAAGLPESRAILERHLAAFGGTA